MSADGKGVAMRPEARRRASVPPGRRVRNFEHRPGIGEIGHKWMAEAGCVFDVRVPPGPPRTSERVMAHGPGSGNDAPRSVNRWYACDITAGRDVTVGRLFDEAERRDPGRRRAWIALAGGDACQIGLAQAEAAARGVTVTVVSIR